MKKLHNRLFWFLMLNGLALLPVMAAGYVRSSGVRAQASATVTLIIDRCVCATSMDIDPGVIYLPFGTKCGQCGAPQLFLTLCIPKAIQGCYLHLATTTINNQPLAPLNVCGAPCQGWAPSKDYLLKGNSVTLVFDMRQFLQASGTAPGMHSVTFAAQFGGGHILSATDGIQLVLPLVAPILTAPGNGCTDWTASPILRWNSVNGACAYLLEVSTNASFACAMTYPCLTSMTKTLSCLSTGTTYFWHVKAIDGFGCGTFSPTWSFTTGAPPVLPTLVFPQNGARGVSLPPTLRWSSINGATSYRLEVATNSCFTNGMQNFTGLTGTTITLSSLSPAKTYYWRVQAVNSFGASAFTPVCAFTTGATGLPGH